MGLNKVLMTGMTLIYLQKTFGAIDNDVILQKLFDIGFPKHTVNWLNHIYPADHFW